MSRAYPMMPGVPAAGHVTAGGAWHPGPVNGCGKCPDPRAFGILFSHASEATVPGLVHGSYPSVAAASEAARRTRGVRFLIVKHGSGGRWFTLDGLTPVEALRRGIDNGFRGWWK